MAKETTNTKVAEVVAEAKKEVKKEKKEKVVFDRKGFAEKLQKAFEKNTSVDVVADTDTEKPRENPAEYEFIHFYKKGTKTKAFELFVKNKDCKFLIGLTLKDFLGESDKYTLTDVQKKEKIVYVRVTCKHEDAIEVAKAIQKAYDTKVTTPVEVPVKETKAKKATVKKAANK